MVLDDLDWRVVCCSNHATATVCVDDALSINVQRIDAGYSITVVKHGLFVRASHGMTRAEAESALSDAVAGP